MDSWIFPPVPYLKAFTNLPGPGSKYHKNIGFQIKSHMNSAKAFNAPEQNTE